MVLFSHLDWPFIGDPPASLGWRRALLDRFRERCGRLAAQSLEVPADPGGWQHQYICPTHWDPLVYVSTPSDVYRCPRGDLVSTPEVRSAWLALRHRELADAARDLALGARVFDDARFADAALSILKQYAKRYASFDAGSRAQSWMLKGRAFHQALTEALWAVPIAYAVDLLQSGLGEAEKRLLHESLLAPVAETLSIAHAQLLAQDRVESNYTAWLNAALGCLGFVLGNEDLVDQVIDGPGGFYRHIHVAVRTDGFEYEGSVYYHNFVLLAYLILAEAALSNGVDLYEFSAPEGQSIRAMWEATASLAYPDGSIPLLNDGAYWVGGVYWEGSPLDNELCQVYEIALARTGDSRYAWLLRQAYARRGVERAEWPAVLYAREDISEAEDPPRETTVLRESGIAVLRDDRSRQVATVVFGPDGGSHTHRDRLALHLWPWSIDPGTPPYGGPARREWYQHTLAHNAIVVDGQSQAVPPESCRVLFGSRGILMASRDLYKGVFLARRVQVGAEGVGDAVLVSSPTERTVDWVFFSDGGWNVPGLEPISTPLALDTKSPGAFARMVARGGELSELEASVKCNGGGYRMHLKASEPFEVLLVRTPGLAQSPSESREALVVRCTARRVRIEATFQEERVHA